MTQRTARRGDIRYWESETLEEHVALIKRQVAKSLEDPELGPLVSRIIENDGGPHRRLHAWGASFKLPDDGGGASRGDSSVILNRIWNFVALNWSYIEDPEGFDLFAHIKYGMNARAHAQHLRSLKIEDGDTETERMVALHIQRLEGVKTPGAGDCDDATIVLASLCKEAGFREVRARVVSVDANNWGHVYAVVGMPAKLPTTIVALDPTVKGAVPGWEYERSKVLHDFEL